MPKGVYQHTKPPWNKGLKGTYHLSEEGRARLKFRRYTPRSGWRLSEETRRKMSEAAKRVGNRPPSTKGRKHTAESRLKMSIAQKARWAANPRYGPNAAHWKGGITKPNKLARTSAAFVAWREAVFSRDDWTCQECGQRGGRLHAHHIKRFSKYPELRYDVYNGITLCRECHFELHRIKVPIQGSFPILTAET